MFDQSASYYDAIYEANGKDYTREVARLHELIQQHQHSAGTRLLDVACGTGGHLAYLRQAYTVEGLDADAAILQVARAKFPNIPFHHGDMVDFALGHTFDVVICLFSSIGYVKTLSRLQQALDTFAQHTAPGGLIIVEPWFAPGVLTPGHVHSLYVDRPEFKLARMNVMAIEENLSILNFHYLIATKSGVTHTTERHELGLFPHEAYLAAFAKQGLTVTYDAEGLTGRGLYIGVKPLVTAGDTTIMLRPTTADDEPFLWEMLYQAIHVPEGEPQPDRALLQEPALAHYVAQWSERPGDEGLLALDLQSGQPVGAIWIRLFTAEDPGWGFVDAATPELSMAILPAYRGQGIGTALLTGLITQTTGRYPALSLSVDPRNAAMRLYARHDFVVVGTAGTSLTMRRTLSER
ncbi:MAG: GNAT family N-acetyltransferase [Caldilineaceae bacterium]